MSLKRWMVLVGCVAVVGLTRVALQTAVWLKSYEVGRRTLRVHALENAAQWKGAELIGAQSPRRLARVATERKLDLVAWSPMPMPLSVLGPAPLPTRVAVRPQPARLARESVQHLDGQDDE